MTPDEQQRLTLAEERLERLINRVVTAFEKIDRLAALASSGADRYLLVADRLDKTTSSLDRNSDQLSYTRQKLSEIHEQREYIRAGLDQLRAELSTHFAVVKADLDDVDRGIDTLREHSGRFPLISPDDIRKEADQRAEALRLKAAAEAEAIRAEGEAQAQAVARDPWYSRVLIIVFRGSGSAKVTAIILAIIAAVALIFGGLQTIRQIWGPPRLRPVPAATTPAAEGAAKGASHADDHKP